MNGATFDRSAVYPERNGVKGRAKLAGDAMAGASRSLPDGAQERFREVVEELLSRDARYVGRGGVTRLAKDLKVKQPAVSAWRAGGGASMDTLFRLAKVARLNPHDLLVGRGALEVPGRARFPNLETCVEFHGPNHWLEATVAAARAGLWPDDVAPLEWVERLNEVEAALGKIRRQT